MPEPADWCGFALIFIVWESLPTSATGLGTPRCRRRKSAPHDVCLRTFNVCIPLWRLYAGDLRVCRVFSTSGSNLRTAATPSFGTDGAAETHYWRYTMFKATPNPPESGTDSQASLDAEKMKEAADRAFSHYFPPLHEKPAKRRKSQLFTVSPRHRHRSPSGQCLRRPAVHQRHCCRSGGRCGRLTPLCRLGAQPFGRWRAVVGGAGAGSS